ncbi:MAG: hypothetical protein GY755_08755, partial [Chloroflexi bacterium]|nr:hypothetical protein [Chloroflexota bacterium]
MPFEIEKLVDERNKIATDMRAMVTASETEERGFTVEEQEIWDKMNSDYESVEGRISTLERANVINPEIEKIIGDSIETTEDKSEDRHAAFEALLRSDQPGLTGLSGDHRDILNVMAAEARAQSVGTDSAGGY